MNQTSRKVRMGIDVGGTYTKCVAMDNETHEIIGKNEVKTTHDAKEGVALGVVQSFENCLRENGISPDDVVFVAHSTTQATNAFIEGDVAPVGIIGVAGGGVEGLLAKRQLRLKDVVLDEKTGKKIPICNEYIPKKKLCKETIHSAIQSLSGQNSEVIVASMAFGVDSQDEEKMIYNEATSLGLPVTMGSDITKLYGLTRRTRTAAINASILPKMVATANATENSVKNAGVKVPLMIMRGDGGVMEISEMRKRPILTALSGPAASVMGSLMYLRASNAIYFEVGGTTTNIGVIKNGRPGVDYANIGGHDTYINSLDVRILGCAGGSMIRINDKDVVDVGPRSAHIAGCDYACFTDPDEIEDPQIELVAPKDGDPNDYVVIRLKNGKRITITNTDAANVLGLIDEKYFAHGNAESARKAMQPIADRLQITVEQLAEKILEKDYEKVSACINALAEKYHLDHDAMKLVGCGGGAASLVPYCAKKMGLQYSIPENAEVISSIGVSLAMVRDVIERVIPNPTEEDIAAMKKEAIDACIDSGAAADTVEVHIEIDNQSGKVTAIATGSTEVKTTDLLKECSQEEALELAQADFGADVTDIECACKTDNFYVFTAKKGEKTPIRIIDKKGFIRVQCSNAKAVCTPAKDYQSAVEAMWDDLAIYKSETILRPDYYLCIGPRVCDYSAVDLNQNELLMNLDIQDRDPMEEVLVIGDCNDIF
ncbi:hydantoinase/oxoprolinase family protein [Dubosiella muris]|uniref:Hydantoinase/oxoprolinase family protein n=1 Tax=Dubosiella muris TaxID=3038133 RepID=A0AC61R7X6_9FIRM|nr:hydantoinase/oxoprolinase family protein [Dubosiella muris]TGY66091.1 hydantoinase/oxoprolinase family protein [Dubosiella muris]